VPVNLPNREERSLTEAEEERARTKENIAQSNTHPTQSGKGVSQDCAVCDNDCSDDPERLQNRC
jgi:hypothetical protein